MIRFPSVPRMPCRDSSEPWIAHRIGASRPTRNQIRELPIRANDHCHLLSVASPVLKKQCMAEHNLISSWLERIMILPFISKGYTTDTTGEEVDRRVREVIDHMTSHLGDPLTLSALARYVGLSKERLLQLFKPTGQTPFQILRAIRIGEAAKLLDEFPERGLKEVAWAVGYRSSSPSHFSRDFRAAFGKTPARYRRNPQAVLTKSAAI
jgi:AraC-like DNA-binding protein